MKCVIVDGYVDEPTCLGVPPYISPHPRYIAGAMVDAGISPSDVHYCTIDQLRCNPQLSKTLEVADLLVLIAGNTVPGRYLGATPITLREIKDLEARYREKLIIGGPLQLGYSPQGGTRAAELKHLHVCRGDLEAYIYEYLREPGSEVERWRSTREIARWSVKGAFIIKQHPGFPRVMCELETYRGCHRHTHCSFCTEPLYEKSTRRVEEITREVAALYNNGARYFRLGRQPDLLTYQGIETPEGFAPNPDAIEKLYRGIRQAAPELKVLHLDNMNPTTIAEFPEQTRRVLKIIVKYHTSGDVAALGVESADPAVIRRNNLKVYPEDVITAVEMINEVGAKRGKSGLPELLPGLNFVYGLPGETKHTYALNLELLTTIYEKGLLLRRINLRQVMSFPHTPLCGHSVEINNRIFAHHKRRVHQEIDQPMLRRVVPRGTILRHVILEAREQGITLGRQIASYPLLVGIPEKLPPGSTVDVMVTGYGYRSITGVPVPLAVNKASLRLLREMLGRKNAARIITNRPFKDSESLETLLENHSILQHLRV